MLNGLAITPPVIGRIAIGKLVERQGKRLPEKDDGFTLTSQVQGKAGWIPHPWDQVLRTQPDDKLRSIPVRLLFNEPGLNFRATYSLFDRHTGRPVCVGNGRQCKRVTDEGITPMPCPAPEGCALGMGSCKPHGRLNVQVDLATETSTDKNPRQEEDELGSFVFRTAGFNSIRTLSARLAYLQAVSGGVLASLPLALRLRGKSSMNRYRSTLFYVDLTTRAGCSLTETIAQAQALAASRAQQGWRQDALDQAAQRGLAQGAFEEDAEEGLAVLEEFDPEDGDRDGDGGRGGTEGAEAGEGVRTDTGSRADIQTNRPTLTDKLARKVQRLSTAPCPPAHPALSPNP